MWGWEEQRAQNPFALTECAASSNTNHKAGVADILAPVRALARGAGGMGRASPSAVPGELAKEFYAFALSVCILTVFEREL